MSPCITRTIKETIFIRFNDLSLKEKTWANTNCHISGMMYCWICQFSIYSDTSTAPGPTWVHLPHYMGAHVHFLLLNIVLMGGAFLSPPSPPPLSNDINFLPYFGSEKVCIGKYNIFPQT